MYKYLYAQLHIQVGPRHVPEKLWASQVCHAQTIRRLKFSLKTTHPVGSKVWPRQLFAGDQLTSFKPSIKNMFFVLESLKFYHLPMAQNRVPKNCGDPEALLSEPGLNVGQNAALPSAQVRPKYPVPLPPKLKPMDHWVTRRSTGGYRTALARENDCCTFFFR